MKKALRTLCIVEEGSRSSAMYAVHRLGCRHINGRTQDWIVEVPHGQPIVPPVEASINVGLAPDYRMTVGEYLAAGMGWRVSKGDVKIHSCCKR